MTQPTYYFTTNWETHKYSILSGEDTDIENYEHFN